MNDLSCYCNNQRVNRRQVWHVASQRVYETLSISGEGSSIKGPIFPTLTTNYWHIVLAVLQFTWVYRGQSASS